MAASWVTDRILFDAKKQHDLNMKIPKDLLLQSQGDSSEFLSNSRQSKC